VIFCLSHTLILHVGYTPPPPLLLLLLSILWLVASNLRKILRCILNENDILAPILCCNGENHDDDATNSVVVKADDSFLCSGHRHRRRNVDDDDDDTVMDSSDYDIFRTARQMLGTLNDDWNAYTFLYHHTTILHKEQQEQEQRQRLDTEWNEFRNWTVAVHWVDRLHRLVT
jgi:hypothetical protein